MSIPDFISNGPFIGVYLFLFMVVSLRSTATYGLGRYGNYMALKARQPSEGWRLSVWSWVHSDSTQRGAQIVRDRGLIAVPLSFLTVGFQTVVIVGAGALGVSVPRWILAATPGWLAWAAIYSTIGFAVWGAMISAAAGSPAGIAVICTLVVSILVYVTVLRPRRVRQHSHVQESQ
ncbi:MAG: hypothetical protein ACTH1Z_09645 [Ancrocorticia sp.]|uniref:hypothetical protein n=1 Tax=Ancrocorticia sp. TaxID=2593684 RepID=UPI003F918C6F